MEDYILDSSTGFLDPTGTAKAPYFTSKQKAVFIDSFKKSGNFTKSSHLACTMRDVVIKHFEIDAGFYKAYRHTVEALCDQIEENLLKLSKHNPTAAIKFLQAYRKSVWADSKPSVTPAGNDKLKSLLTDLKNEPK